MEYLLADAVGIPRIVWYTTCAFAGIGIGMLLSLLVDKITIWRGK